MPLLPLPLPSRRGRDSRRRCRRSLGALSLGLGLVLSLVGCRSQPATEIGVYSGRHYNTDKDLYRAFTARTGIRVRLLEGKDSALIERVRNEGAKTQADVLVLVDAARLDRAARLGVLQPVRSAALERDVPAPLRDPEGRWFALTRRVRLLVLHPSLGEGLARSYEDLARPELRGRLCLRDSRSVYNQSLVADQLIRRGEVATAAWVRGMVANLGQPLFSSDIPLARAVARGECGAALVNSYYVARMLAGEAGKNDQAMARKLRVVIPDPAHVNVSGAGVTRHSRQVAAATRLIEFLASPEGGRGYAAANHEYPLRGSSSDPILQGFGPLRSDGIGAAQLGERNAAAVALMQANGWR